MKHDVIELDYERLNKKKLMAALTEAFPDWFGEQETRLDSGAIGETPPGPVTTAKVANFSMTGRRLTYPASTPRKQVEEVIEAHYLEVEG